MRVCLPGLWALWDFKKETQSGLESADSSREDSMEMGVSFYLNGNIQSEGTRGERKKKLLRTSVIIVINARRLHWRNPA